MLNTTNSNSEYLHNYIRKVAKQEQESVDTSNIYTGTIEATQSGIYTVTLNQSDNSSSVLAIPIVTGDIYDKNDYVYLLKANTTATVNYFIVGKVDAVQETFFNLTDLERFNPDSAKTKDYVFGAESSVVIEDENNIFNNISNLGYFQFEVKFNSKIDNDTDGFEIYLNYVDDNEYSALFTFKAYEFIGQPNEKNYNLVQKKIFHLPADITITNIKIKKIGNFTVLGVNLVAGSLLEVSAAYQNNIIVQNDRNYFEKEMPDASNPLNTITLTSKVYYNNKPLVGDALQYYWFLKDDEAIDDESVDYLDIEGAGNGWRCLNAFTSATTADEQEIRLWDNKNNFIVLNKTNKFVNFSNFVNKVKCIVKYFDNFIESDLIDIYNYDYEQFSATLTTNVDPVIIINRDDEIQLECKITNNNSKSNLSDFVYKYEWHLGNTVLSNLKDGLIKVQDKSSTFLEEKDIQENVREMENNIEEYYCKVSIYHKNDVIDGEVIEGKQPISEEISNTIQVTSAAAATDIQEEVQYKYYIADNHRVTFKENVQVSEDTELSKWSGDWDIYDSNVTKPTWTDGSFEVVFNDLNLFNNKDKTKEYFVYYTKRTVVRQGLKILRKETGSFPQIARSVIYVDDGWKNHRVGDNVNQLNTFNQLTKNGEEDGIHYAEIPELVKDSSTPIWGTTYYKRIATDSNIEYEPITLKETISFKETETYYVPNEDGNYSIVAKSTGYDSNIDYYKKINDTEYQKLIVNTQNFDIEVDWPDGEEGPFYKNIDNKLFINATYIRSGTLEVNNKFYASIDQDDVRIAGFNVDDTTFQSKNGTVGLNSDDSQKDNVAIWAGEKKNGTYPFQVTHNGDAIVKGKITATELTIDPTVAGNAGIATKSYANLAAETQAKMATDQLKSTVEKDIEDAVNKIDKTIEEGAYFEVSQNIDGQGTKAIVLATDNEKGADFLYMNSNNLIINSYNLKLNHNGEKYAKNHFEINTIPLNLTRQSDGTYNLSITTNNFNLNNSIAGDAVLKIKGTIEATSGKIGSSTNYLEIMSSNGNILNHTNFSISSEGKLKATDADIEGTITSINGEIGGFHIGETSLSSIAHFTTSEPINGDAYYSGNYSTILTSNRLSCSIDSNDDTSSTQVFGWDISLNGICVSTKNKNISNYKGGAMLRAYFKDRDWTKMRHTGSLSVLNKNQNTMAPSITVTISNDNKFLNSDIIAKTSPQKNSYYYVLQNISSISTTFNIYQGSNAQGTQLAANLTQSTLTNTYGIQFSRTVPTNAALGFQIKVVEISSGYTYSTTQYVGSIEPLYNGGSLFVGGSINEESGAVGMYAISSYRGPYIEFTPTQAILHYNSKAKSTWVLKDDGTGSITEIK